MPIQSKDIREGVEVRRSSNAAVIGRLTGKTMEGMIPKAQVIWPNGTDYTPLGTLELYDSEQDQSIEAFIKRGDYSGIDSLRMLLTFEKLRGTLTNVVYSMQTADIDFYAHQFVPVLKFIQSPLERLLIADEVGLGKTIEGGLIWTECRARNQARRLLVVCPPTLVPKWVKELNERFDVPAESANINALGSRVTRLTQGRTDLQFALVTSYHAIRPKSDQLPYFRGLVDANSTDNLERRFGEASAEWEKNKRFSALNQLATWDLPEAFADLVIFDEGHLMKNTSTATHMVGRILEQASAAMVVLSATPLTNRTRDLYSLLKLVDPNMFPDEASYNDMRERNLPVIQLLNCLGKSRIDIDECKQHLSEIEDSGAKRELEQKISSLRGEESKAELIAIKSAAQKLNELGAYLTRTRKVDVVQNKVIRVPIVLEVEQSDEEEALYQGLLKLIRKRVRDRGDAPTIFHLMASALSMSSCLPALAERMQEGKLHWGTIEDLNELQQMEEPFLEGEEFEFVGERAQETTWDASALANYDFAANDRKYEALKEELFKRIRNEDPDNLIENEKDRKIIIFAFFKSTLKYLYNRLNDDGIRCLLVTGDITDKEERYKTLNSFQNSEYDVMLCSEVAAEGVDLQFCRILVNYDMPWNPMRVEQRIGRIDRIGQKADKIVIINLLTKGTIDASIYYHLHNKIGLFKSTIGDLEGIIGAELNQLTHALLADDLSDEERISRIEQTAAAIETTREMETEVNQESENLVGLRSVLQDSVEQDKTLGRYIKPLELRMFADTFFKEHYTGNDQCDLNWSTPENECLTMTFSHKAYEDFGQFIERKHIGKWPNSFKNPDRVVEMAFDPDVHVRWKQKYRKLQLVTHVHPFIQWIAEGQGRRSENFHPVSAVRIERSEFAEGTYLYFISKSILAHKILKREELIHRVLQISTNTSMSRESSELLIQAATDYGSSLFTVQADEQISTKLEIVQKACEDDHNQIENEFMNELELRRNAKLKQVDSHYQGKINSTQKTIKTIASRPDDQQRGLKGFIKNLENLKSNYESAKNRICDEAFDEVLYKPIASGIIEVNHP